MKYLWIWSILLRMLFGNFVYYIMCVGTRLRDDLARVVRPAMLRNFVFQPASFELRLSMRNWNSLEEMHLFVMGNPRYLHILFALLMFIFFSIKFFKSWEQFFEK